MQAKSGEPMKRRKAKTNGKAFVTGQPFSTSPLLYERGCSKRCKRITDQPESSLSASPHRQGRLLRMGTCNAAGALW
jgi:hypothetical protein